MSSIKVVLFNSNVNDDSVDVILKPFEGETRGYLPQYLRHSLGNILTHGLVVTKKSQIRDSHKKIIGIQPYESKIEGIYITDSIKYYALEQQLELLAQLSDVPLTVGIKDAQLFPIKLIANLKGFVETIGGEISAGVKGFSIGHTPLNKIHPFYDNISFTRWLETNANKSRPTKESIDAMVEKYNGDKKTNTKSLNTKDTVKASKAVQDTAEADAQLLADIKANQVEVEEVSTKPKRKSPPKKKVGIEESVEEVSIPEEVEEVKPKPKRKKAAPKPVEEDLIGEEVEECEEVVEEVKPKAKRKAPVKKSVE